MDYKKSKAPVNTVTRNIMELCNDTDNIYESVAIIGKRATRLPQRLSRTLVRNSLSLPVTMTVWKKFLKTASR